MPPQPMSPRLPGVSILSAEASGSEYRKWRREVQRAFTGKGTWGHCDGTSPMPMPDKVGSAVHVEPQPSLLEERRAWVKMDRDVKLDIFLSVSDDIKMDVFETGPPLPPSAMTAQEMMEALDDQFEVFKFEDYHHVLCHFLNLHIDQYASLEEFNAEYLATLDDMSDHGFPLHNLPACSAYFSKLRCTQNPWVAKKLKEWDTLTTTPLLADLIKEVPPWIVIRPLAYKNPNQPTSESISEELVGSRTSSESDVQSLFSNSSREQEITIHASVEDLTEAFPLPTTKLHPLPSPIPKRLRSSTSSSTHSTHSNHSNHSNLSNMSNLPEQQPPPPINRPLPPIPTDASSVRSQSPQPSSRSLLRVPASPGRPSSPQPPGLRSRSASPGRPSTADPSMRSSPYFQRPTTPDSHSLFPPRSVPLAAQPSMETFTIWPARSPLRQDSNNSSTISLPFQGAREPSTNLNLSTTPPQNSPTRDSFDSGKSGRKRSWSIKARLSGRRYEVKEIIY